MPALCGYRALQPVAVIVGAVAGQRADPPAVDCLADIGDALVNLSLAFLHAETDFELLLQREVLEVEGLARPDTNGRKLGPYRFLVLLRGRELQREIKVLEEVRLHEFLVDFGKLMAGAAGGAGCPKKADSVCTL